MNEHERIFRTHHNMMPLKITPLHIKIQAGVLADVAKERHHQDNQWGESNHIDGTGAIFKDAAESSSLACDCAFRDDSGTWQHILRKWLYKTISESNSDVLRRRLVQMAAIIVAWIECLDRKAVADAADRNKIKQNEKDA